MKQVFLSVISQQPNLFDPYDILRAMEPQLLILEKYARGCESESSSESEGSESAGGEESEEETERRRRNRKRKERKKKQEEARVLKAKQEKEKEDPFHDVRGVCIFHRKPLRSNTRRAK